MAEDKAQEKTEQPTAKRRAEAREKGQVPRSRELSTMAVLLSAGGAMIIFGNSILNGIMGMMQGTFQLQREDLVNPGTLPKMLISAIYQAMLALAPLLLLILLVALISPLVLSGWSFSTKALAFKWEKLNPVKGLGKVFSVRGLMELLKALAKFLLVLMIAMLLLWGDVDDILLLGTKSVMPALADSGHLLLWSFLALSSAMILIAAIDVPFQLWDYTKQLRMTRQEIKDEFKETDGNPEMKRRVREVQQEMAQRRMMEEVPRADVVVTNPTHYAVALSYDQSGSAAPVVVAKGKGLIAAHIRNIATQHQIPVVTAPPLTRALFHTTELQREIPAGLFMAVAQVLAYTYQLRRRGAGAATSDINIGELPIPDDMRYD